MWARTFFIFMAFATLMDAHAASLADTAADLMHAGTHMADRKSALHNEMHRMMIEADEDDIAANHMLHGMGGAAGMDSMDDYIKESEEGLSAALGPRWSARKLETDADTATQSLLQGISGGQRGATGALRG